MVIINRLDNLRNTKGRPMSNVTSGIPFPLHLRRRDGVTRSVAMCHALIGWTWVRSSTRHLVFLRLGFWEAFKSFFFSFFFSISIFSSISTFPFSSKLRLICFLLLKYDFFSFFYLNFLFLFSILILSESPFHFDV